VFYQLVLTIPPAGQNGGFDPRRPMTQEAEMNRMAMLACLGALALPSLAAAQAPASPQDDARYSFSKTDDGFLRLDRQTGQVSICSRKTLGWACETVADERAALEGEIARLQTQNAALKKELISNSLALPRAVAPGSSERPASSLELKLPTQADVDRVVSFMEKVWRRMVESLGNLQKDMSGRT
jgi:hypothetical protein